MDRCKEYCESEKGSDWMHALQDCTWSQRMGKARGGRMKTHSIMGAPRTRRRRRNIYRTGVCWDGWVLGNG